MKFFRTFLRPASVHNLSVLTVQTAIQARSAAEQPFHYHLEKQLKIMKHLSPNSKMELFENKENAVVGFIRNGVMFIFKLSADKSAMKISTYGARQKKRGSCTDQKGNLGQNNQDRRPQNIIYYGCKLA
jgi:hypothetical protein